MLVYVWGGGAVDSEVERLLTRLIMGTDLPAVTLFNDMLLGSAPCWSCDSSAAAARVMDRSRKLKAQSFTRCQRPGPACHLPPEVGGQAAHPWEAGGLPGALHLPL